MTIVLSVGFATITYTQTAYLLNIRGIDLTKIPGLEELKVLDKMSTAIPSKDAKISFTAKVSDLQDMSNILGENIKVGDTIKGEYMYNPSTKDTNRDETVGDYQHNKKPYGIIVKAGELVFKTDPKNVDFLVELVNRETGNYLLRSYNNLPLSNGVPVSHISWQLDDETGKALSSASLKNTPTPPVLQNWNSIFGLTITGGDESDFENSFFIRAHVDSVKLVR